MSDILKETEIALTGNNTEQFKFEDLVDMEIIRRTKKYKFIGNNTYGCVEYTA